MFTEDLDAAEQGLRVLVLDLDPDAVPLCEALDLWKKFDSAERLAASAKTLLARRVEEAETWKKAGYRSAAEQLAVIGGSSIHAAKASLETSKHVCDLPKTAHAMRSGLLSVAKAEAIVSAATVAPDAEDALLDGAERAPLGELRDRCLKAKAVDRNKTHARIHRDRRAHMHKDGEGAFNFFARGTADTGSGFMARLQPFIEERFRIAKAEGRDEPMVAHAYDALMDLAELAASACTPTSSPDAEPSSSNPKPTAAKHLAILRLDYETLIRGSVDGEETCEIAGLGSIPVRIARELLGDAILKLVITKGVDVANVTHLGRSVTVAQQVALLWQAPECERLGCTRTQRLENDHREDWVKTHHTRVDESDRLCGHDHHLKTDFGWALVAGKGKRAMVPPDDPRHPNYRAPPTPSRRE
jgi:Domain of unknown function (DUF222)